MNVLQRIQQFFARKLSTPTAEACRRTEGYEARNQGENLWLCKQFQEALTKLDLAIERGFTDANVFFMRASCLQTLEYHLDAIEDFDRVISMEPQAANNYLMRSISKGAAGDLDGSVADLKEAIHLSKLDTPENRDWDEYAREIGHNSASAYFESQLQIALIRQSVESVSSDLPDEIKIMRLESRLAKLEGLKRRRR